MFTYIKPEFMIHAFKQQRDILLDGRSICVARLGDFAVSMGKVSDNSFSLSLENVVTGAQYAGKVFNVDTSSEDEIIPLVDEMFHKMQDINEKEIFEKRECIWKWYAMSWLKEQDISFEEYFDNHMLHNAPEEYAHWKSFEEYMAQDSLNVAATMELIDKYVYSEEEKNAYKAFAAKDIVELRQRQSLETMQESFAGNSGHQERKAYSFGIDVVADSREEAREKLRNILNALDGGEFFLRG